jgi:hypothetical protein
MINLWKCAGICVVVTLVLASSHGITLAQDGKVIEGTLLNVDANTRVITLQAGDKEMKFTYTEQTELVGPQKDGQPVTVRQGSRMRVYYKESEQANIATKIEVTEV